ncbi:MAG: YcaO-like family protein [Pseudomonadota bacterium]
MSRAGRACEVDGVACESFDEDTPKRYFAGSERLRSAEETLQLVTPLLDEAGITRVAVATGLDTVGVPVVLCTRPLAFGLSVTQGKGVTLAAAKASAVMEAIEHYHAETIQASLRYATETELVEEGVVDTALLVGRSPSYSASERLLWQQGRSLAGDRLWLPFDTVHLDLRVPGPSGRALFMPSSNGLASGNSKLEATCHGLCEVIERHLISEFYELDVPAQEARRVDSNTIDDPTCRELLDRFERARVDVATWDLSNDLGIPGFMCEIVDCIEDPFRAIPLARGYGCHTDRGIALCRALCEAAQSRLTLISGARDDIVLLEADARRRAVATAQAQAAARRQRRAGGSFQAIPKQSFQTFGEELSWLAERLEQCGLASPIVVDLSKPRLPISVVRVVVPGLRFSESEQAIWKLGAGAASCRT